VPLSLGSETIQCVSCGYSGPPPPQVAEQLSAAAQAVRQMDAGERQLAGMQRRVATAGGKSIALYLLVSALVFIPLLLFGLFGVALDVNWDLMIFFWLPLIIGVDAAVIGLWWIIKRRRALQEATAAVPPRTAGATASCRVCGASLEQTTEAIIRCGYCESDNLVAAEVLQRLGQRKAVAMDNLVEQVKTEAASVRQAGKQAGCAMVWIGLAAPFASIALMFLIVLALWNVPAAIDTSVRYTVRQTTQGSCVGRVSETDNGVIISYGGRGVLEPEELTNAEGLELRSYDLVIGRRVRVIYDDRTGTVERIQGLLIGDDQAVIRPDSGDTFQATIAGLCFIDEAAPAP
jgi:hypothetical protein